ncbi:MAG: site-specific integrase [Hyphomicrobiales bacterium]|nr:site-specific integrase [Hyphomicrobiales bacterium]
MPSIRKRSGKWQVQVRRIGAPSTTKTFNMRSDALEWARKADIQIDRMELEPDRKVLEATTLGDIIRRYRDEIVPRKKGARDETIVLNCFLGDPICKRPLSQLDVVVFAKYRDARLRSVSSATVKRQLTPVRSAINLAMTEWGIPLRKNPLAGFKIDAIDNRRERRLKNGELESLLSAARTRQNPFVEKVILFAIETAMRRGEILALQWIQVDLKRRSVTILESKNGYSRTIPVTPAAVALLHTIPREGDLVFPISANALRLAWGRMVKRFGIEDLRFHDLRHEAISRFFEIGLTVPEVASISGHRDTRMLMRYAHASSSRVSKVLSGNIR